MITQTIPPLVIICNLINQKIPPSNRECGARLNKEASCTQKDTLTSSKKVQNFICHIFVGRVEKTDPRSADYPLTPAPRTTLRTTPRTTLWTTPTDYPKKSTKFLLRGRKIQEA